MRTVAFLATFALLLSLPAGSAQNDDPRLDEGFNLGQKLGGHELVYYLTELCTTAAKLEATPEKTKQYSWALFRLASTEQNNALHTAGQKNAVTCLSYVDPRAAMDLLSQINFQRPLPGQMVYEDPRYDAAEVTFRNFLDKVKPTNLSAIVAKARYLGQTGQYPYGAIAAAIRVRASSKEEINTLLRGAINFYVSETGFYNRDEEFLFLLQSVTNRDLDHRVMAQAVAALVHRLKDNPIQYPGHYYAEIHTSSGKVFPFVDRNQAFLFQAFPIVKRYNPALAAQLRQQEPQLDQTTDKMGYVPGGFIEGDPTSGEATQQRLNWFEGALIQRINDCAGSNPEAAVRLAQHLSNPSLRIVGFSKAVTGLVRTNAPEARKIYEEQLSQLNNLPNSPSKLQAMVALVPAAYSAGDLKHYQTLSERAFGQGVAFFIADTTADRAQNRSGLAELEDLLTFAASVPGSVLDSKVDQLPDGWLKAYLWLYEAKGHASRVQDQENEKCRDPDLGIPSTSPKT